MADLMRPRAATARPAASRYRWVVVTLIFLVYTMAAADRANIGIVLPFVKKQFEMTNAEAGAIASLFFVGYSLGQIPAAFLVQAFGVRRMFCLFMVLTSAFTGLLGTAASAFQMKIIRLALGFAEAPLPVCMLSTVNRWFPPDEQGLGGGIFLAAAKFGPVIVPPIGAIIIASFGWQYLFFVCAIPGLIFSVAWFFIVANSPRDSRFVSDAELAHIEGSAAQTPSASRPVRPRSDFGWLDRLLRRRPVRPTTRTIEIFRSPSIWGLALSYLLMTGIINVILAWLPTYLTTVKHLSILNVGFVASAPFVGGVLGNLIGGWFSDRIAKERRKPTIIITALSSIFMMYALVHAPSDPLPLALLLFATGLLLNLGYSSFAVYPMGLSDKATYPMATSVVNTGGQAGGAIFPLVTGYILDAYSWDTVFLFLAASSFVALVVILFVVEPEPILDA